MKLIIENFYTESNIYISRLNSGDEVDIYYDDLNINNNTVSIDEYNFKNGIYRIDILDEIELIYIFYDNKDLVYKKKSINCCVKIKNNIITEYDEEKFIEEFEIKLEDVNSFKVHHWNLYWYYLHWFTHNYPNNPNNRDKDEVLKLVKVMRTDGIKCVKCLKHFNEWLDKHDITNSLSNRSMLFRYFFNLHNDVNKRKEKNIMSIEEATQIYNKKDWDKEFIKYRVDIVLLFKKRKLDTFPKLFYTIVKDNLMKEYDLD